jgi:hypothetical protein
LVQLLIKSTTGKNFVEIRNLAAAGGEGNTVALLTIVSRLLGARSNITASLKGIYDKTWQAFAGRLSNCIEPI